MDNFTFEGFEPANTTPVPDIFFDELLSLLGGAELKALLYIFRRTLGFKKTADAISLNQFQHGITTREGKVLDKGCGIKDRKTLCNVLGSLEKKWNCVESEKVLNDKGEYETTIYRIKFRAQGVVGKSNHPVLLGDGVNPLPVVGKSNHRSRQIQPGVVGKSNLQETVIQETVIQEDTYTDVPSEIGTPSPLSLLLKSFREGNETEQQATLQILIDAGIIPVTNENDNHSHSSTIETSSQSQNSTTIPEVSLLPAQQAENASCETETHNSTPTSENGSQVALSQASDEIRIAPTKKPRKKAEKPIVAAQELEIKAKLQEWINKERGYKLYGQAPAQQVREENQAVQTLAHLVYVYEIENNKEDGCTREELAYVRAHIRKYDPYWSKPENKGRIGAYAILQKLAELVSQRRKQQHPSVPTTTSQDGLTLVRTVTMPQIPGYNNQVIDDDDEPLVYVKHTARKRA